MGIIDKVDLAASVAGRPAGAAPPGRRARSPRRPGPLVRAPHGRALGCRSTRRAPPGAVRRRPGDRRRADRDGRGPRARPGRHRAHDHPGGADHPRREARGERRSARGLAWSHSRATSALSGAVPLPPGLDLDRAEARVKNGVLTVRFPKVDARPGAPHSNRDMIRRRALNGRTTCAREDSMGKVIGIDLGTTNSVVAVMEGGEPRRHPQPGGEPPDPVGRRLHQGRRDPRRPDRQAAGRHESREHRLLDQAVHGPPLRRGRSRRSSSSPTRSSRRPTATSGSRSAARSTPRPRSRR